MKKLLLVLMVCFFMAGCGTAARQSEFYQHSTMYQSWSHAGFSMWGYKNINTNDARKSNSQHWWGIPVSADQAGK
jgi:uncharacterized protein YceK